MLSHFYHLYEPARTLYHRVINGEYWAQRLALRACFAPFVAPGDLVFDVGANRGEYGETFTHLGGRVIAIEPNPVLARKLRKYHPRLTVVEAAVGAQPGQGWLRLAGDANHSTISDRWAGIVPERCHDTVMVQVTTLDDLIGKHGSRRW